MAIFSDYGNVPDKSERLSIPSLVFLVITFVIVSARLYTRFCQGRFLLADDWIIVIATLCAEALGVLMILCSAGGFGKHITDLNPPIIRQTLKYFFVSQVVYKMSISFTKLSILAFYRRLFYVHTKFRQTCNVLMAIVVGWILAALFSTVFQCTPVAFAYDKRIQGGRCINLTASWYANAVFNITSDFVITLAPMPVISSLQMKTREKFMLCGLFALGFLVCGTSILRATTIDLAGSQSDRTWHSVDSSMWSVVEANLAIIGSCMPILKKPLTRIMHLSTHSSTKQSRSGMLNITAQSGLSTNKSGRFSRTAIRPINSRGGDSSSEEGILAEHGEVELYSIKKTQEIHMHGIVLAERDEFDDVARGLAVTCSQELGLATVVIECADGTDLDHFRESILVDSPTIDNDNDSTHHHEYSSPLKSHRFGARDISLDERRVADVVVAKNLNQADHYVQIQALELVRTGRMYTHTAMHSTGKNFLLIALNEFDSPVPMSRHLNDLFAIAHHHQAADASDSDSLSYRSRLTSDSASYRSVLQADLSRSRPGSIRSILLGPDTLVDLRLAAAKVNMTAEVSAYLQNVIVAMRLHRYVAGGISALATRHLRMVARSMAVLHGLDYVTPAIVGLAVRKVYLHRLVLADERTERSLRWGSDAEAVKENMKGVTVERAIDTVLASVQSPL
ncbi:AAA lid domain-containing protein [Elsinoe fawcettii]|nr:AAA lid domain-containing protein [Elsinoe fawcettii]